MRTRLGKWGDILDPLRGRKRFVDEQDQKDFEHEKEIQEWLEREGRAESFDFKYISRKGTARNTFDKRFISLDQKMRDENGSGTYADIIGGSDGRDLECGIDINESASESKSPTALLDENIDLFFDAIGASEGTKAWAKKSIKSQESLRKLRSLMKEEKPFEISPINLELPRRWGSFRR